MKAESTVRDVFKHWDGRQEYSFDLGDKIPIGAKVTVEWADPPENHLCRAMAKRYDKVEVLFEMASEGDWAVWRGEELLINQVDAYPFCGKKLGGA